MSRNSSTGTTMVKTGRELWIDAGYREMARNGLGAIRIDRLAKTIGKSRSGFYHCFGDKEGFEEELFRHHRLRARQFAEAAKEPIPFYPGFAELNVAFKDYLFFHKQLSLLRNVDKKYLKAFNMGRRITEPLVIEHWKRSAHLGNIPNNQLRSFFKLIRATVFAKMDYDSFNADAYHSVISDVNRSFRFLIE